MNPKTAHNIISRYTTTGSIRPKIRGGANNIKYNKDDIIDFLLQFYSHHICDDATLEDVQDALTDEGLGTPSLYWICKELEGLMITRKKLSISPLKRNCPEIMMERYDYVIWRSNLSEIDEARIVCFDEHGFGIWLKSHYGRSLAGEACFTQRPTQKNQYCTCPIAISKFGKLLCTPFIGSINHEIFQKYILRLLDAWEYCELIPIEIRSLGPILLLDSASVHQHSINFLNNQIQYRFFPRYSPFLNETELINNNHKLIIKSYLRNHREELTQLENLPWGEKITKRGEFLVNVALLAWGDISNETVSNCYTYIVEKYFSDCLNNKSI
jgi:hypothetical protein